MKNKLILNELPPIYGYQHHAYALGIVLANPNNMPWLYNNYIQLIYSPNTGIETFSFDMVFFPYQEVFAKEYLDDKKIAKYHIDLLTYLKDGINNQEYIYTCVDEYFIPHRNVYHTTHYIHDILIYGYDDDNQTVNVIGFNANQQYVPSVVSYDEIIKSNPQYIYLLKYLENNKYRINLHKIINDISEYLRLCPSLEPNGYYAQYLYVLEAIDALISYIDTIIQTNSTCDIRPFHILLEHKKCMKLRLEALQTTYQINLSSILVKYDEIIQSCSILRNTILKYNIVHNLHILTNAKMYIKSIEEQDKTCLLQCLDILKPYDKL